MSSENKSGGSKAPLILLLLFLIVAGVSWFFFSNTNADVEQARQELGTQVSGNFETPDEEDSHAGHDHGHNHSESIASTGGDIGTKGKIHKLNQPAIYGTRGVGDPNAPVKIQEFFSLTCNHCAEFHKNQYQEIKKNLIDTGKVYFVYEEFPLNGPALYGSMIARCLPKERYVGFVDILLRNQDKWAFSGDFKASLMQNAKLAGMSEEEFETCFANTELQKAIGANIKEATDVWRINSTPSFVVNDGERVIYGGKPYAGFETLVNQLTGGEASRNPADEMPLDPETNSYVEETKEIGGDVAEGAEKLGDGIKTDAAILGNDIEQATEAAGEATADAVRKGVETAKEKAPELGQKIDDVTEAAGEATADAVRNGMDAAKEGAEAVKQKLQGTAE